MMKTLQKALCLLLLTSCGNLDDTPHTGKARQEQKKAIRTPKKASADAKQHAETLLKDPSKADAWRQSIQADLNRNINKAAPAGKADILRTADAAAEHAYKVTQESQDPDKNLASIIDHATQCAIQCRQASPNYANVGTRLDALQDTYDTLSKRLDALKRLDDATKGISSWTDEEATKASNKILAGIESIIKAGCIDTMLGQYHEVTIDGKFDEKASQERTDRLLGKASKAIAKEALDVWKKKVIERPTQKLTIAKGKDIYYKFNLAVAADRKAFADILQHLSILLVEALKAHHEAKSPPKISVNP